MNEQTKKHRLPLAAAISAVVLLAFGLVAFGQIQQPLPVPVLWQSQGGDAFGVSVDAVPQVKLGTVTYTGLTSTNLYMSNEDTTNRLTFKNGILVASEQVTPAP